MTYPKEKREGKANVEAPPTRVFNIPDAGAAL